MALIKISIVVDIDTTDTDIEDLRDDLLDVVCQEANLHPEDFVFEPIE